MDYVYVNYTKEQLENFRDNDGFIDFDKIGVNIIQDSAREKIGNDQKDKYWVQLKDKTKILLKSETTYDGISTSSPYAELICSELAKQVGIECAECDLVKFNKKRGIYSQSIKEDKDQLYTLNSILNLNSKKNDIFADAIDLIDIIKEFPVFLKGEDLSKEDSYIIIRDMLKQIIFQIYTLNCDGHTENMSIIKKSDNSIHMSKMYDNEESLLLNLGNELLKDIAYNQNAINVVQKNLYPKIVLFPDNERSEELVGEDIWKNTLDKIYMDFDDDNLSDFIYNCSNKMDINLAISNVQKKIKSPVPEEVRRVAALSFLCRKKDINKILLEGNIRQSDSQHPYDYI